MQFTDLIFLFVFFPVIWLLYFLFQKTPIKNLFLVIASLAFYAWGAVYSLFILLFVILWNYLSIKQMQNFRSKFDKKMQLIVCVAVNLIVLLAYKYIPVWFGFAFKGGFALQMPIGLSFYMFSCLSAVFDIYYKKTQKLTGLVNFTLFAGFFAWVNMGPIAHYTNMEDQLDNHPVTIDKFKRGGILFLSGIIRKVLIADNLALLYQALSGNPSWLGNLLFGFAYFFQLYFDFSGYSRMARGLALFFGFEVPENFNHPYTALSVQDFWRRWHISLTSWFRDYVYIPLGGNRVSSSRWMLNILAVWLLTGIWHGASLTFLIWGLYQAVLILMEKLVYGKYLSKAPAFLQHTYLVLTQLIGWTWFSSATFTDAFTVIGRYFGIGAQGFADSNAIFYLFSSLGLLAAAILCSTDLPAKISAVLKKRFTSSFILAQTAGYLVLFAVCVAFLIAATNRTFLYAAF